MHLKILIKMLLATCVSLQFAVMTAALRDVHVQIPSAVRRGEKAILKCFYDLEGDTLYSVKWYKGRREFYSYTPKETPAMKVFQFAGIKIDRSASNESQLVLDSVNVATTGKYSCEVSADAPSFHTLISAGDLEVVVPGKEPVITGIKSRYHVGDIIRGNCTSAHSRPAANITWTINGYEANPSYVRQHKPIKDLRELETVISSIHFVVIPQHFIRGKLKIRCAAFIHDVYWKSSEKSIEEDRHKGRNNNEVNLINTFSEDYFDVNEGDDSKRDNDLIDRSDTYFTHIKGDMSSLNANGGSSILKNSSNSLWLHLTTLAILLVLQTGTKLSKMLQQLLANYELSRTVKNNKAYSISNNNNKIGTTITITTITTTTITYPSGLLQLTFLLLKYYYCIRPEQKKNENEIIMMKKKKKKQMPAKASIQAANGQKAVNVTKIKPIKQNRKYCLTILQEQLQQQQQRQQQQQQPYYVYNSCNRVETKASKLCYSSTSTVTTATTITPTT